MTRMTMTAALLACAFLAVGCAQPRQLSPQAARSMVELRQDLAGGKAQIERTTATLVDLKKNPRLNTAQQIGFFHREVAKLEVVRKQIRDTHTHMVANTEDYFEAWDQEMSQIHNPKIAKASEDGRAASMASVKAVQTKLDEGAKYSAPFLSNLKDIDRYLETDNTPDGVERLMPIIDETLSLKRAVIRAIDEAIAEIDSVTSSVQ